MAERTKEIVNLHLAIAASLRRSVQDAIKIGELLSQQKDALPHGEFLPWIERELPFKARTAEEYMRVYEHKTKCASAAYLEEAYRIAQIEDRRQHPKARPVQPEVVQKQRERHEAFAARVAAEDAKPEPERKHTDVDDLLRRARQAQDRSKTSLERELAGDADPASVIDELKAFSTVQLGRTCASGLHMVVNEMVKFWREKSIELNRKVGAA